MNASIFAYFNNYYGFNNNNNNYGLNNKWYEFYRMTSQKKKI